MGHQKSLFESVVFNIIKTFSSLAFPVITFGYASRKLGDLGIGQVSWWHCVDAATKRMFQP